MKTYTFNLDYDQGIADGGETNPRFLPGYRTGEALDAYKAGYDYGLENCYQEQEDDYDDYYE